MPGSPSTVNNIEPNASWYVKVLPSDSSQSLGKIVTFLPCASRYSFIRRQAVSCQLRGRMKRYKPVDLARKGTAKRQVSAILDLQFSNISDPYTSEYQHTRPSILIE